MNVVAFDTETHGFDWFDGQTAFLATWADADNQYYADVEDEDACQRFLTALMEADTIIAHNLSFDVHQVKATWGLDIRTLGKVLHDTDLLARIVAPYGAGAPFGAYKLKNLASVFVDGAAKDDEDAMKELASEAGIKLDQTGGYYDFYRAYPNELIKYALNDARVTYDLFQKLHPMLDERNTPTYELEMAVAPILIEAEDRGVAVNPVPVAKLYKEYKQAERDLMANLEATLGPEALGGRGSEEALLEALQMNGVPLYRTTEKSGKLSTSKFALQEFEDDFPFIADLMEYRRVNKFLSTYIEPLRDREVVHTSFRQCEAWTGRMSSARPNLQNLPKRAGKEVREPLVARPGYKLCVADYDGIEARLLAYFMNDENYIQLFEGDHDPHAWMAAQIHGGEPSDFAKDGPNDELRSAAKNTLFAITYGAGAPRVADMNKIDKPAAKALISQIKGSLPKYRKLMGRIRKKVQHKGYVNTLMGRKQTIKKEKAYVGLNALIQGSAADIMKQGLVNTYEALKPYEAHILLVVHDELVVEAREDQAEEVLETMFAAMTAAFHMRPSLDVSGSITDNYMEA